MIYFDHLIFFQFIVNSQVKCRDAANIREREILQAVYIDGRAVDIENAGNAFAVEFDNAVFANGDSCNFARRSIEINGVSAASAGTALVII